MDIDILDKDGITLVTLTGDLDTTSSRDVQAQLLPRLHPGIQWVLELTGVAYMSSAGLRVLLSLYRSTATHDGRLVLVGLSPEIRDTMEVTGFLNFFTAFEALDEALASFGNGEA